jgi:hypothetical protein
MRPRPPRPFSLLDAMALVAALALGLALARWRTRGSYPNVDALKISWWVASVALPATAAVLLMGLRREPLRRLARRPGFVASAAALLAVAWGAAGRFSVPRLPLICGTGLDIDAPESPFWTEVEGFLWSGLDYQAIALAVQAAWGLLLAGRRWRAEPTWIDRLGRALGAVWIAGQLLLIADVQIRAASDPGIPITVPPPPPPDLPLPSAPE